MPDLFYVARPGSCVLAKGRAYRGPLSGWRCRISIDAFPVRKRGISPPRMKTPRTLRRPLHGIEPATRTALRGIPSSANASIRSATTIFRYKSEYCKLVIYFHIALLLPTIPIQGDGLWQATNRRPPSAIWVSALVQTGTKVMSYRMHRNNNYSLNIEN